MKKFATAVWQGNLKAGKGSISTESGALADAPYGFNTRFEGEPGTNPEELIGAAHAGCFSMALSNILGESGLVADRIQTRADVTLERLEPGFTITAVHLTLEARIPGASDEAFLAAAAKAKENCPISRLLNATITLDARLEQ
ncbi:OsmC family protein [Corticimicrobacter populi]|uniref:OsmC family peroxiredoxin n=1 Tax=Corticimicrobacter populi TaxID=2175229 RepID=A0A2V1K7I3_9BURK|nr:OsmC family protein [Corticimicrobacter populi]PWF24932.1 OsmC family peroxiredoxin [Corticimicrobacter populi]